MLRSIYPKGAVYAKHTSKRGYTKASGVPCTLTNAVTNGIKKLSIYGNTVSSSGSSISCGDKTANVFDIHSMNFGYFDPSGDYVIDTSYHHYETRYILKYDLPECMENTQYTFSAYLKSTGAYTTAWGRFQIFYTDGTYTDQVMNNYSSSYSYRTFTSAAEKTVSHIQLYSNGSTGSSAIVIKDGKFMCNEGASPLAYEPYGYKIPIALTGQAIEMHNIYIDKPLSKTCDHADQITLDYISKKAVIYRYTSDESDLYSRSQTDISGKQTWSDLPSSGGTYILSTEAAIEPSNIKVQYIRSHSPR